MATPIIQIKRGSGNPTSLALGELAFDTTGKSLMVGTASGILAVGGELVFAKKTYADAAVLVETNRATAAEGVLTTDLASEVTNRTSADAALGVRIDNILSNTTAGSLDSLTEVVAAFEAADSTINGAITALSSAASTGLTNEVNRATAAEGVLTTDLASEVTNRTSADVALGVRIDNILSNTTAGSLDSLTEIVTAFQAADSTLNGAITTLSSAASTGLAAEVTRATAAEGVLTTNLASEVTRATGAEVALSTRVTDLEGSINGGTY